MFENNLSIGGAVLIGIVLLFIRFRKLKKQRIQHEHILEVESARNQISQTKTRLFPRTLDVNGLAMNYVLYELRAAFLYFHHQNAIQFESVDCDIIKLELEDPNLRGVFRFFGYDILGRNFSQIATLTKPTNSKRWMIVSLDEMLIYSDCNNSKL